MHSLVVDLPRYVFLVKNLRGVLAVEPDEAERYASWLARRFRYRDLGVPPCLVERARSVFESRLGGNPFHALAYPTSTVEQAAARVRSVLAETGLDDCVAEALLLASSYAAPLHVSERVLEGLRRAGLVVHEVRGSTMDAKSARLHLRIVDYSVLDAYVDTVYEAVRVAERSCSAEELRRSRLELAKRDEKRYWRLAGKGDRVVVAYVDHASRLAELDCNLFRAVAGSEARILLPLMTAFNLDAVEA